nr:dehydrogenase pate [Quercus suber]
MTHVHFARHAKSRPTALLTADIVKLILLVVLISGYHGLHRFRSVNFIDSYNFHSRLSPKAEERERAQNSILAHACPSSKLLEPTILRSHRYQNSKPCSLRFPKLRPCSRRYAFDHVIAPSLTLIMNVAAYNRSKNSSIAPVVAPSVFSYAVPHTPSLSPSDTFAASRCLFSSTTAGKSRLQPPDAETDECEQDEQDDDDQEDHNVSLHFWCCAGVVRYIVLEINLDSGEVIRAMSFLLLTPKEHNVVIRSMWLCQFYSDEERYRQGSMHSKPGYPGHDPIKASKAPANGVLGQSTMSAIHGKGRERRRSAADAPTTIESSSRLTLPSCRSRDGMRWLPTPEERVHSVTFAARISNEALPSSSSEPQAALEPHECCHNVDNCAMVRVLGVPELFRCILGFLDTCSILTMCRVSPEWQATVHASSFLRLHLFVFPQWCKPAFEFEIPPLSMIGMNIERKEANHSGQWIKITLAKEVAQRFAQGSVSRQQFRRSRSIFENVSGRLGPPATASNSSWQAIPHVDPVLSPLIRYEDLYITQPPTTTMQTFSDKDSRTDLMTMSDHGIALERIAKLSCDAGITIGFVAEAALCLVDTRQSGQNIVLHAILSFSGPNQAPRRRLGSRHHWPEAEANRTYPIGKPHHQHMNFDMVVRISICRISVLEHILARCRRKLATASFTTIMKPQTFSLLSLAAGLGNAFTWQQPFGLPPVGNYFGLPGQNATYDYVIVGGGTAGLVVAARLVESNRSLSVAVVEPGTFYEISNGNNSQVPTYSEASEDADITKYVNKWIDWDLVTVPQAQFGGARIHYAQGKALGGSSARNQMIYNRGTKGSYDLWAKLVGDESYSWTDILPFFKKSIHFTPPSGFRPANATAMYSLSDYSSTGGPLQVSYPNYVTPFGEYALQALQAAGFPRLKGFSSGDLHGASSL